MGEYVTFVQNLDILPQGKEIELTIKDLTYSTRKYNATRVKAVLHRERPTENESDYDVLRIRSATGFLYPEPWFMKITEELDEFIPRPPYSDLPIIKGQK